MQRLRHVALWLFVIAITYVVVLISQVWAVGRSDQSKPVDAIVVLGVAQYDGRPSPQLQARLDHALNLWNDDLAQVIITTGGNKPGDRFTEAQASANFLISSGVPEGSIVLEATGTTTRESLLGVYNILQDLHLSSALIVTDPYHALRSKMIAQDLGVEAFVSPTRTSPLVGASAASRHVREAIGVGLAQLIGFANLERLTK